MFALDAAQRARLADYWWSRAEGEMTSWVGFRHVLADLRAERSPDTVVSLAERAVGDEYRHALFCRDWAVRFGHAQATPQPRSLRPVQLPSASARENRLLRITLCCMTETIGCILLRSVRPRLREPELRQLNRRHLADELRHSRVGWAHLSTLDKTGKATVRRLLPTVYRLAETACCSGPEEEHEELVAFGYFTPGLLKDAHTEAVQGIIRPGLAHLGIAESA